MLTTEKTVVLTDTAAHMLKQLANHAQKTHWGLKFADQVSLCGEGYNYVIDLVSFPEEQDEVFLSNGIEIYVPKESLARLAGSIIDIENTSPESIMAWKKSLHVQNPNITGPCPCACGDNLREWIC